MLRHAYALTLAVLAVLVAGAWAVPDKASRDVPVTPTAKNALPRTA